LRRVLAVILLAFLAALSLPALAQRVVVFPMEQEQGPPSTQWIGTGLAVALDECLWQGGVLTIPYEDLKRHFDQSGLVDDPSFRLPSQVALCRQFGAGILVTGSYAVKGERLAVQMEALQTAGDLKRLGSWTEEADLQSLLALSGRLEERIFKVLGQPWKLPPPVRPEAFESYIRGRTAADPTLQEVYYRKAIEIQPDYYDAQCYLAVLLKESGRLTEAASLLKGLETKSYAKAYLGLAALAEVRMDEGRLLEGQRLLLASLKASESPEAHLGLARLYLKQKRMAEAQAELAVASKFGTHGEEIESLRRQIEALQPAPMKGAEEGK
jgi:tetratricopeptide (TPR) repeat protein